MKVLEPGGGGGNENPWRAWAAAACVFAAVLLAMWWVSRGCHTASANPTIADGGSGPHMVAGSGGTTTTSTSSSSTSTSTSTSVSTSTSTSTTSSTNAGGGQAAPDWRALASCIAWWNLDDGAGLARANGSTTSCGANCNLTLAGTEGQNTTTFIEGTASMDNTSGSGWVYCTDANCGQSTRLGFTGTYTIGGWFKRSGSGVTGTPIFNYSGGSSTGYYLRLNSSTGNLECIAGSGGANLVLTSHGSGASTTIFEHAACGYNGTNVLATLNGDQVSSGPLTAVAHPAGQEFELGDQGEPMTGLIDEAYAFNVALTAAENCRIARCGVPGLYCMCSASTPANYLGCTTNAQCQVGGNTTALCDTVSGTCRGRHVGLCAGGANAGFPCQVAGDCPSSTCTDCTPPACNLNALP